MRWLEERDQGGWGGGWSWCGGAGRLIAEVEVDKVFAAEVSWCLWERGWFGEGELPSRYKWGLRTFRRGWRRGEMNGWCGGSLGVQGFVPSRYGPTDQHGLQPQPTGLREDNY